MVVALKLHLERCFRVKRNANGSTGQRLSPGGEGVPGGGVGYGNSDLLHEDQENAGRTVWLEDLARGPQVVDDKQQQENVSDQGGLDRISADKGKRPTGYSGNKQRVRGYEDQSFVSRGIEAGTKKRRTSAS